MHSSAFVNTVYMANELCYSDLDIVDMFIA